MKRVLGIIAAGLVLWFVLGGSATLLAHDGSSGHRIAAKFDFNYNHEHGVYCGWRHSYEGISCVKVGD